MSRSETVCLVDILLDAVFFGELCGPSPERVFSAMRYVAFVFGVLCPAGVINPCSLVFMRILGFRLLGESGLVPFDPLRSA